MTIFGLAWGYRVREVTPLAKLIAIRFGDCCDQDACGIAEWGDLQEWCCAGRNEIEDALRLLALNENVIWSKKADGTIGFSLPVQARAAQSRNAVADTSISSIYVIRGRSGHKIGISGQLANRVEGIRAATVDDTIALKWSHQAATPIIRKAERLAHALLAGKLIRNEWFDVSAEEAISAVTAALNQAAQS